MFLALLERVLVAGRRSKFCCHELSVDDYEQWRSERKPFEFAVTVVAERLIYNDCLIRSDRLQLNSDVSPHGVTTHKTTIDNFNVRCFV
jgi:hypothetical protein